MESVRDQIAGVFSVRLVDLPKNWNRYPCVVEKRCEANGTLTCKGFVEIYINKPCFATAVIEILFFRPKRAAFIRAENSQLRKLIELKIIDPAKLVPVL